MSVLMHKHTYLTNTLIKTFRLKYIQYIYIYVKKQQQPFLWFPFKRVRCKLTHWLNYSRFPLPLWPVHLRRCRKAERQQIVMEGGRKGDLEAIKSWQLRPGVADSEDEREEEREKEGTPHDCHNDCNICACVGH